MFVSVSAAPTACVLLIVERCSVLGVSLISTGVAWFKPQACCVVRVWLVEF